ncbi:octaprenyl diphosphate synthase [Crenobacter intestini]|uniref:Octaprenyl diphosphate synthase n=1 Tax=Crenobacter intestini TaxID=2563443 RepID=A0A4T0UXQ1_9NEIS|nr:octaprenyl diphosphate synthase [Crenobacter intestini]
MRGAWRGHGLSVNIVSLNRPANRHPEASTVTQHLYRTLIAEDMQAVDQVIRASLHSDVVLIRQMAEYIIGAGGKRMRPALVLLAGRACGCQSEHLHRLAAMIEFIHTSTLLHDDVVDESGMRRGRQTANALFGNAASVLVGDFLYTRAFQMMVQSGSMQVLEVMAEATNIIAEGEVLQLLNIGETDVSEDAYLTVIRYKTAKLFEAAARVGALISDAGAAHADALAAFGMHLGTAFQIIDDVLDYSGDAETIGKSLGDDLAEGKPTLPLIYTMRQGGADAAALVRRAIENADRALFPEVLAAVQSCGALDYARSEAEKAADAAITAIAVLPDSDAKRALVDLAHQAVDRQA